jgi:S1-C subfamily serine protease
MWRTISISFISAVIGGLIVFGAVSTYQPNLPAEKPPSVTIEQPSVEEKTGLLTAEQIYEKFAPSVVHIKSVFTRTSLDFFGFPFKERGEANGSGFIIDKKGFIVTNAHVVQDARGKAADSIQVILPDETEVAAKLVGSDPSTDIALLKINVPTKKLAIITLGDSSKLKVGDTVYAIGNPFGYDRSMTKGIISALGRTIEAPNGFAIRNVIQTDAAVNPGNSGGPLINAFGRVIGVNAQIASKSEDFAGIAFAIPSNTVKRVISEIKSKGRASHAWLGIQGQDITPKLRKLLRLPTNKGILIVTVIPNSPAEKAGLKGGDTEVIISGERVTLGGDIILKVDDQDINSMDILLREIEKHRPGDKVKLTILRDQKTKIITVTLGERPAKI